MEIKVKGNYIFEGSGSVSIPSVSLLTNINPLIRAGLEEVLGVKTLFFKQSRTVCFNAKTISKYLAMNCYCNPSDYSSYLSLLIGVSTSKNRDTEEIIPLKDKAQIGLKRLSLDHSISDFVSKRMHEDDKGNKFTYLKILSKPRRKNDKKYTLYFDFSKYKDDFLETEENKNRESWVFPIAELATDSISENFKGSTNAIFILVDLLNLFYFNEKIAIDLLNNILGWFLFSIRGVTDDECQQSFQKIICDQVKELECIDCGINAQRDAQNRIESFQKQIEEKYNTINRKYKEISELEAIRKQQINHLKDMKTKFEETDYSDSDLTKEINEISKMPFVKDVHAKIDSPGATFICVTTEMIYITKGDFKYKIGEFEITLPYVNEGKRNNNISTNEKVTFINLTPGGKRRSYWGLRCHHPHVDKSGYACLGNGYDLIFQCINTGNMIGAVDMAIAFLQQANTSDPAGRYLTSWDVVDDNDNIIYPGYLYDSPPKDLEVLTCEYCGSESPRINGDVQPRAIDGKNVYLCNDCASTDIHICASCDSIIPEYKNGFKNEKRIQCKRCGSWYCNFSSCYRDRYLLNDESAKILNEEKICTKCANEELAKRNEEKKKQKEESIKELLKKRAETVSKELIEEGDSCPDCNVVWDEHYHCEMCGTPVCGDFTNSKCICLECQKIIDGEVDIEQSNLDDATTYYKTYNTNPYRINISFNSSSQTPELINMQTDDNGLTYALNNMNLDEEDENIF